MDDVRKLACDLAQRGRPQLISSTSEQIADARLWESYLREPVPEAVRAEPGATDEPELFPEFTDEELHAVSMGWDQEIQSRGNRLAEFAEGTRPWV